MGWATEIASLRGTPAILINYAVVAVPMEVALIRGRAPLATFLRSPLWALLFMVLAGIVNSLLTALLLAPGVRQDGLLDLALNGLTWSAVGYAGGWLLARNSGSAARHRRGAVVSGANPTWGAVPSWIRRLGVRKASRTDGPVTLAGVPVPVQDETKHFKIIGTTGTGKSTAIRELLNGALARGDRAIIADPDGGYLDTFYDQGRGDVILNPFATGSARWNLFGEINRNYDVDQ